MNQISADHEKLRTVLISKLGLPTDRFQRDNLIAEAVKELIKERDDALQLRKAYNSNVKDWRELCGYFNLPVSTLSDVLSEIDTIRKERDELLAAQPQLTEIRYVLHGDIQPCSVLYSDDTTTLLRLDEGDIMCETDTIEWSDSVTYRCQELLKSVDVRSLGHVAPRLAQLVRDERILLNDNGDDAEVVADDAELFPNAADRWRCTSCLHDFPVALERCPKCYTPKTAPCQPDTPSEWTDTTSPTPLR